MSIKLRHIYSLAATVAVIMAVAHAFTVGYGPGSRTACLLSSAEDRTTDHAPSSMTAIYERKRGEMCDFIHLKIDTTYRAIGRNGFHRELVCDRTMSLRCFDGIYADCENCAGRCFARGSGTAAWHDTGETRRIMDYECRRATADFDGRRWEVWYTDRLPYCADGARRSDGLQGLILEAGSQDGRYSLKIRYISETIA